MTQRKISLIDVTLRDAHQCLWATRMSTAVIADLAPRLDRAGFEAIDLVGGAVFDVCVRFLRENPRCTIGQSLTEPLRIHGLAKGAWPRCWPRSDCPPTLPPACPQNCPGGSCSA